MALFNYECDEVKRIIKEVSPNYPQLTTYEKEWLYFHKYGYIPGVPVELEYETVSVNPTGSVSNAIPHQYKRAILKGQTLVNLANRELKEINVNINNSYFIEKNLADNIDSKKKYLIRYNYSFISGDVSSPLTTLLFYDNNGKYLGEAPINESNFTHIITPKEGTTRAKIRLGRYGSSHTSSYIYHDIMVIEYQEGMENWDIPYFEGMKSVQMPVLKTTGKNLFNPNWQLNTWYPFNLKSGTKLTLSTKDSVLSNGGNIRLKATDETDVWMGIDEGTTTKTITLQKDVYKLTNMLNGNIEYQLEIGDNTPYEPYKTNILTVNEEVELGSAGDVKDELNLLTRELTQRTGEIVLDGSEDWVQSGIGEEIFYTSINDMAHKENYQNSISCDKFITIRYEGDLIDSTIPNGITGYLDLPNSYPNENWIYIKLADSEGSVEKLKQWLSQNPATVRYELTMESVKTVDLTPLNKPYEGTNHYHLSSNIPCEAILEVPVVSTGEQTLQEINN